MRIGARVGPVWVSGGSRGRRRRSSGSGDSGDLWLYALYFCGAMLALFAVFFAVIYASGLIAALSFLVVTYFLESPQPTLLAAKGRGIAVRTKIYDLVCRGPKTPTPFRTFQKLSLRAAATWILIAQTVLRVNDATRSFCYRRQSVCAKGLTDQRDWINTASVVTACLIVMGLWLIVARRYHRNAGASVSADVACPCSDRPARKLTARQQRRLDRR